MCKKSMCVKEKVTTSDKLERVCVKEKVKTNDKLDRACVFSFRMRTFPACISEIEKRGEEIHEDS